MVWACIAHGEKHTAEYDHGDSKHSVKTALALSAVIFFVVDGNLFYNSTTDDLPALLELRRARERPQGRAHRGQRAPVGVGRALRRPRRQVQHQGRRRDAERHPRPGRRAGPPPARLAGRHSQLLSAEPPHQAGRDARHDQPDVVPGQGDGRVRHRLRPALRLQPLQDEGHAHRPVCRRVRELGDRAIGHRRSRALRPEGHDAHWGWDWRARN